MIKFKCIYCGQKILAKDDGVGKKGKCPKCAHLLTVPDSTEHRPAISVEKTESLPRPKEYVPEWDKDIYSSHDAFERRVESIELFKERWGFLIPKYDSLSVFLLAMTWILFLITSPKSQDYLLNLISFFPTQYSGLNVFFAVIAFLIFVVLCFYMVLSEREKTAAEKIVMAFFAVITTIITAYASRKYLLKDYGPVVGHINFDWRIISNWWIIFPLWNIFSARILAQMLITGAIDDECVSDRRATPLLVFLAFAAVFAIFLFCNYTFKLHWAVTFSICTAYTTSFDKGLQSVFPGLADQEEEQAG
jgi:phage FluMu protein Com